MRLRKPRSCVSTIDLVKYDSAHSTLHDVGRSTDHPLSPTAVGVNATIVVGGRVSPNCTPTMLPVPPENASAPSSFSAAAMWTPLRNRARISSCCQWISDATRSSCRDQMINRNTVFRIRPKPFYDAVLHDLALLHLAHLYCLCNDGVELPTSARVYRTAESIATKCK